VNDRPHASIDRRALSRAITRAAKANVAEVLRSAAGAAQDRARLIGVTGAPGAGKSTLVGRLAAFRLHRASTLGIVAIDPSSPRTQGSVLGDRIRMEALGDDPRVFIRSLPSRHAHDGLTENLPEVLATFDEFGFDEVIIETVGVGQTEYGVRALVDVEVLLLTPGAGDYVQAMKAGIMETADVFVVNKADLPGAERLEAEVLSVLRHRGAVPPVIRIALGDDTGVGALSRTLDELIERARQRDPRELLASRQRFRVQSLVQRRLEEALDTLPARAWERPIADIYRSILFTIESDIPAGR
jgi:LAO/AO transport system kinase